MKQKYGVDAGECTYGRKVDMAIGTRDTEVVLSSIEWKKKDTTTKQLLLQQTKKHQNEQVQPCTCFESPVTRKWRREHMHNRYGVARYVCYFHCLRSKLCITSMYSGFAAYMYAVRKVDGIYTATFIDERCMPLHPRLVCEFTKTLTITRSPYTLYVDIYYFLIAYSIKHICTH